jgi:hypothetical protein
MKRKITKPETEVWAAQRLWGTLAKRSRDSLTDLVDTFGVSVSRGDVQLLGDRWYVTHAGLLRIATNRDVLASLASLQILKPIFLTPRLAVGYSKLLFLNLQNPKGS